MSSIPSFAAKRMTESLLSRDPNRQHGSPAPEEVSSLACTGSGTQSHHIPGRERQRATSPFDHRAGGTRSKPERWGDVAPYVAPAPHRATPIDTHTHCPTDSPKREMSHRANVRVSAARIDDDVARCPCEPRDVALRAAGLEPATSGLKGRCSTD